jgi:hypothetical protein
MNTQVIHVDIAPSWGEMGNIVRRLSAGGKEQAAMQKIWPDVARAFAAAEALSELMPSLNDDQKTTVSNALTRELSKQARLLMVSLSKDAK